MRLLLDTCAFLWAVREPATLSPLAADLISRRDNDLVVSALVPWELAIKYRSGRLPEAGPVVLDYPGTLARLGASSWPITHTHTLQAGLLPWGHRDPFDRLLAAVAIMEGLPLVSRDPVFDELPDVRRIWD